MATIPQSRLEQVIERFEEVEARMGATTNSDEIVALSREHAELKPVAEEARALLDMRAGIEEAEALLTSGDAEMAELAQDELQTLRRQLPDAEKTMQLLLLPRDSDDKANIVLEVRAGTGGDEAALFAGDLFRMYTRYAQLQGWKVDLVSA
jgi:peptide chain release factor 1